MWAMIASFFSASWWSGVGVISSVIIPFLIFLCKFFWKKYKLADSENVNLKFAFDNYELIKEFKLKITRISTDLKSKSKVIELQNTIDTEDKIKIRDALLELETFEPLLSNDEKTLLRSTKAFIFAPSENINDFCNKLAELSIKISQERRYLNDFRN